MAEKKETKQISLPEFVGVDVGKNTTKVMQVTWDGKKPNLSKAFDFQTGNANLTSETAADRADLTTRIKDAIAGAGLKTKKCVVALPEPSVFNRLLTFPDLDEKALNEAIHWNAKQFIPIPLEDVQMDWIKTADIETGGKKMVQLLLVAAPKKLIDRTVSLFGEAGLEVIAIETESVATARAVALNYPDNIATLVLDVGSAGADVSVISNGNLIFSQSLGTGSDAMTLAISSAFKIDSVQAEQYKVKFGLAQNQGDQKIYNTIAPVTDIIIGEVTKTINFFRSKYQQSTPQRIIILGEGGQIPGLPEYMKAKIGIETMVADLGQKIKMSGDVKKDIPDSKGLLKYAVALGLALKTE